MERVALTHSKRHADWTAGRHPAQPSRDMQHLCSRVDRLADLVPGRHGRRRADWPEILRLRGISVPGTVRSHRTLVGILLVVWRPSLLRASDERSWASSRFVER